MSIKATARYLMAGLLLMACGTEEGLLLAVDLRTDFAPEREFTSVEVSVEDQSGAHERVLNLSVSRVDDFIRGRRVAEVDGLVAETYRVRVRLLDGATEVARKVTTVGLTRSAGLTVIVTRSCRDVRCPPTGSPSLTECLDAQCVDPLCSDLSPAFCGNPFCGSNADCVSEVSCTEPVCALGSCLLRARHDRCDAGFVCDVTTGCISESPPADGGPPPDGAVGELGSACTTDIDCATRHCANDVCCESPCDELCEQCSGKGTCDGVPDDALCGTISCDGLDGAQLVGVQSPTDTSTCEHRDYAPLTSDRCASGGGCVDPDGAACTVYVATPEAMAGICQRIALCPARLAEPVENYPAGTSCGGTNDCDGAGSCVEGFLYIYTGGTASSSSSLPRCACDLSALVAECPGSFGSYGDQGRMCQDVGPGGTEIFRRTPA